MYILKLLSHLTPRKLHDMNLSCSYLDYGVLFPTHLVVFVVVLSYSVIAPLILIPGAIYFGVGWIVYRNQLLFVYVKEYESYGRHWTLAFKQCAIALAVFQVTLSGYLATKKATWPSILSAIMIPFTYYFYKYCMKSFEPQTRLVPLEALSTSRTPITTSQTPTGFKIETGKLKKRRHRSNTTHVDPNDVILSNDDHHQERYQTEYKNPLFVKPLARPWVPVTLGPYIFRENSFDGVANISKSISMPLTTSSTPNILKNYEDRSHYRETFIEMQPFEEINESVDGQNPFTNSNQI
ncbi:hypothetical protein HK096_011528 [Nowakowskiella sp. JEL0078]|nr:hypothetical protein HK096_011528 [Nowakowskiella sp. JEL0078]